MGPLPEFFGRIALEDVPADVFGQSRLALFARQRPERLAGQGAGQKGRAGVKESASRDCIHSLARNFMETLVLQAI